MTPSLDSIESKLYVVNEYGVKYQDSNARLDTAEQQWLASNYGVRTDWHPTCIGCQARQLIKYKEARDKDGTPVRDFRVPCKGIPAGLGAGALAARDALVTKHNITKTRANKLLLSTVDPVAWAELFFGFDDSKKTWRLRPYQKEQLRCSSKRIVIREGRRSGKTFVSALKLLYFALTRQVPAGYDNETGEQLFSGPEIMIVTPYQSQILNIFDEMEKLLKRNRDLMKRLTTSSGGSLYVKTPFFHMDFDNGAIIKGFVSGVGTKVDGSGGGTMRGQNATIIYLDEMDMIPDEVLDKVVMPILLTDQEGDVVLVATSTPIGKRARFYSWCFPPETLVETPYGWTDIKGLAEPTAALPVLTGNGEIAHTEEGMVRNYDGEMISISPFYRPVVSATSNHPVYTRRGWVQAHELTLDDELFIPVPKLQSEQLTFDSLKLRMCDQDKTQFAHDALKADSITGFSKLKNIPRRTLSSYIAKYRKYGFVADQRRIAGFLSAKEFMQQWHDEFNDVDAQVLGLYLAEGSVVRSVKNNYVSGIKWTFHASESELIDIVSSWCTRWNLPYVINDRSDLDTTREVIVYKSWLGYVFGAEIGISHDKQIPGWFDPIFTESLLKGLLQGDGGVGDYVDWTITLTAQNVLLRLDQLLRANGILVSLSSLDRPGKKPCKALHSIAQRYCQQVPGGWWTKVRKLSSSDYVGHVYNLEVPSAHDYSVGFKVHNCLEDPTFKEDHLPSTVLPQWDKIKGMLEGEGTQESFRAEYMAEFIEGGHGVFKPSAVFQARADYRYNEMYNNGNWWRGRGVLERKNIIYAIGIDWNKNAGTEFVVVACDPTGSTNDIFGTKDGGYRYWVVEAINIAAGKFSADQWKREVIRLNHKWQPHYIYADEGYGHTIIEDLKLLSIRFRGRASDPMQVSTSKLADRLKSFNFSSNVEMRSPVDGQKMKKAGKAFLVENAVRQFEDGRVWFSLYDEQLKKELLNYVVLRRSPTTNKPVYGAESPTIGDHRLDAFMLALAGIQLEEGIYVNGRAVGQGAPAHISEQELKNRAGRNRDPLGIRGLFNQLSKTGAGNSKIESILPRRFGESQDEAIRRAALDAKDDSARVKHRSRGMMKQDLSVYEYYDERAGIPAKLYETDEEHSWQPGSAPHVVNPRGRRGPKARRIKRR